MVCTQLRTIRNGSQKLTVYGQLSRSINLKTMNIQQPKSQNQYKFFGVRRGLLLGIGGCLSLISIDSKAAIIPGIGASEFAGPSALKILRREGEIVHSDEEWKEILTPKQYQILRKEDTEIPYSNMLVFEKRVGTYTCAGCGAPLFKSSAKYNSGTGWPSFYQPIAGAVTEVPDNSIFFLPRTEVRCKKCQGHLGHVFDDGPEPTGLRYCMNGFAMEFQPDDVQAA